MITRRRDGASLGNPREEAEAKETEFPNGFAEKMLANAAQQARKLEEKKFGEDLEAADRPQYI